MAEIKTDTSKIEEPVVINEEQPQESEPKEKIQTLLYINEIVDNDGQQTLYSLDMFRAAEIFHSEFYPDKDQMVDYAYEMAKKIGWNIDKVFHRKTVTRELGG